jgi:hypothetical protein
MLGEYHCNLGTDYVLWVLSALLASDLTMNKALLRAMRSLLHNHKKIWEAGGIRTIEMQGLVGNLMIQLATQEEIQCPKSEMAGQQWVITKRQYTDIKIDYVRHGVNMYGLSLCYANIRELRQVIAYRQTEGIVVVDLID